jgi:5S rRNA maturation endonuclease (ribonuclease M5)
MTKTIKKTFNSYNQYELKELSDAVCDNIENLLISLNIEDYKILEKMVIMPCPIHNGDNLSAFNLYYQGDSYRGNWKCRTHQCENTFKSSIIGLVRGCLSREKKNWTKPGDDMVSFNEAIEYAVKFSKYNLGAISLPKKDKEKHDFVNTVNYITQNNKKTVNQVSRKTVTNTLQIPSTYFQNRNFSQDILTKYDVGECLNKDREMYNRAVVPIYDIDHKNMIGCTGRTITGEMPKWRHSKGFAANESLYNFWYAKEHIKNSGVVVVVESPGNVWRLEEAGIHNSVAIFGSSLGDKQKMLLDISGAMTIITLMDNDEAGKKAAEIILQKCQRTYNIKHIYLKDYTDIADMPLDIVVKEIKPLIERHTKC